MTIAEDFTIKAKADFNAAIDEFDEEKTIVVHRTINQSHMILFTDNSMILHHPEIPMVSFTREYLPVVMEELFKGMDAKDKANALIKYAEAIQ